MQTLRSVRSRGIVALAVVAGLAACSSAPETESTSSTNEAVQLSNGMYFAIASTGTSPSDTDALRATGSIIAPFRTNGVTELTADGTTEVHASCGITFIAPQYAITAGHCVDSSSVVDIARDLVSVQMYHFPSGFDWRAAATLYGTWPNITHGAIPNYDSYVDRYTCRVVMRCGNNGPQINCNDIHSDAALIRCDQPVTAKGYHTLAVAQTDVASAEPTMRWTHEVYIDPTTQPLATDFHTHYALHGAYDSNLHYFGKKNGVDYNQLLQLQPVQWRTGDLFYAHAKVTGATIDQFSQHEVVWTDVPGCHGSSGSGMLQFNSATSKFELLGPLALGFLEDAQRNELLCQDATLIKRGQQLMAYTSLPHVQAMAAKANDCAWYGNVFPGNTCHAACGAQADGCQPGLTCVNNACVCVPQTCDQLGAECGATTDGCGHTLNCGTCGLHQTCSSNMCFLKCPSGQHSCGDYCAPNGRICG